MDASPSEPEFDDFIGITPLSHFQHVSEEFVKSIILKAPKKHCKLDPLPFKLFYECLDVMLPYITNLINDSLLNGIVPLCFKNAIVHPLLKKCNLDPNVLNNYRPVSNLPFLSKILEKVVLAQFDDHLERNCLKEIYQSAYKSQHSTETALLKVTTDLLNATDTGHVSILAMLDLSAAFDTLDHGLLLERLKRSYGIRDTVLDWFSSYLSFRQQSVVVKDEQSVASDLKFGVPQGSVLGPILFSLYAQPLSKILVKHGFSYHLYADDSQIYKSFKLEDLNAVIDSLDNCLTEISSWMSANKLKLNGEKTEVMLVGTHFKTQSITLPSIHLADSEIKPSSCVRNLGVVLDSNLLMGRHVSSVRKSCYLQLRRISHIRPYLTREATSKLVCSFVTPRLDYCNSILTALPSNQLDKIQQIQNNAARLVTKTSRRAHITPILKELHWLPIRARIIYKICSIVFQCLNNPAYPSYLKDLLAPYKPSRVLRSSDKNLLVNPKFYSKTYGERSFSIQAPKLWNELPDSLKSSKSTAAFRSNLKTHLFTEYFT